MIIEEDDFKLEGDIDRFDLYLLKTINAKDPTKKREELTLVGYDMYLETCLKKIIMYRLGRKQDAYTLQKLLKDYKKEVDKINNFLNVTIPKE